MDSICSQFLTLPNCGKIYPKLGISFLQKHKELMETEYGFEIQDLDSGFYFVFFGTACLIPILFIQFAQISYLPYPCIVEHQERMTIKNISMTLPLLYPSCSIYENNRLAYLVLLIQA